jgi:uncharacterized protein YceK
MMANIAIIFLLLFSNARLYLEKSILVYLLSGVKQSSRRENMKAVLAFLMLCLISGCATVGGLQPGSGGSTFEVRGKSYEEIWKASVRAMSSNLTIVESDKASGSIKSEARAGMATWGEVVGLFIRPTTASAETYTVEVVSKKRMQTQITGQNWEPSVIANIKAELGI